MATRPLENVLAYIRTLVRESMAEEETDGQLLERFIIHRDDAAFAALVSRYAPLVFGVCQRILGDHHEAEDAFQATFLVLLQKAASVRSRKALGAWLYTVAYHIAVKARRESARQVPISSREERAMVSADPTAEAIRQEMRSVVDEEINRLPSKYRLALICCYLQGKTNREAAGELGWPAGSMSRRLARAQELLRRRLTRRGITVSSALLAGVLTGKVSAAVPASLVASTVHSAVLVAAGEAAAVGALKVPIALAHGLGPALYLSKLKVLTAVLLAATLLGGGGLLLYHSKGSPPAAASAQPKEPKTAGATAGAKEPEPAAEDADPPGTKGPKPEQSDRPDDPPPLYASPETLLSLAYAEQQKGHHREAIQAYRRFLERFPTGEYADRALFGIAVSQTALKDLDAVVETYKQLISHYPEDAPYEVYSAASQLITLAGQLKKPELNLTAYQAMLRACKGSSNRSGMHAGLIAYYVSQKDEGAAKKQIEELFREGAREPNFRANVETVVGQLGSSPQMKPLAEEVRKRLKDLPLAADPDAVAYKEFQNLVASKNYAAAVAKAEALVKSSPRGPYTPAVLQQAASVAENQLKDMRKVRVLCRLWARSMRGEDEGGNLRLALYYWYRACSTLKDAAGLREAADYALAKFPNCSATDDVLLAAVKVRCQEGKFWTDNQALTEALARIRTILKKYPYGSAAFEAKWLEKRMVRVMELNTEAAR